MVAAGTPDMQGSREQGVWFRFHQLECVGSKTNALAPPCKAVGTPQYWDTYWWSHAPGGGNTSSTGPATSAGAAGFYATLLANRRWWDAELAAEQMMGLSLPSPASTNGSYLVLQARHHVIESMITWHDTWGSVPLLPTAASAPCCFPAPCCCPRSLLLPC
jgi:hypothetical protein